MHTIAILTYLVAAYFALLAICLLHRLKTQAADFARENCRLRAQSRADLEGVNTSLAYARQSNAILLRETTGMRGTLNAYEKVILSTPAPLQAIWIKRVVEQQAAQEIAALEELYRLQ